ncbi:MAG: hypothetical protein KBG15_07485 [Kofleriaceae bacterium]|nr:hypothetical protein [Kofleriaceae bacterium]
MTRVMSRRLMLLGVLWLPACGSDNGTFVDAAIADAAVLDAPPVCSAPPAMVIKHTTSVAAAATEVWKASEGVHQLDSNLNVAGTLVIEPCAQVRLAKDVSITLSGSGLLRVGAATGGPVTVDAVDVAQPWHTIYSPFQTTRIELINAVLKNGGSAGANGGGMVYVRGDASPGAAPTTNVLLVNNVRIENSATFGIQLDNGGGFDSGSNGLTITNSQKSPIAIYGKAAGSIPEGTYTGNVNAWFQLEGSNAGLIDVDTTWRFRGLPIATGFGGLKIANATSNAVLTLAPGVIVEMREPLPYQITVGAGSGDAVPTGTLVAVGTAAAPVVFRGRGNKNDWAGIGFYGQVDPRSHFDHVLIEDTGGDDSTNGAECIDDNPQTTPADESSGAIRFLSANNNADVNLRVDLLRNSTIRRSGSNGVLPDFHPGNALDFCATNSFDDIDQCNQSAFPIFSGPNLTCPNAPAASPCACE